MSAMQTATLLFAAIAGTIAVAMAVIAFWILGRMAIGVIPFAGPPNFLFEMGAVAVCFCFLSVICLLLGQSA